MPDLWFYEILNFLKNGHVSSNFRKIWAVVLKYTEIYYFDQRTLVLSLANIDSSIQIFSDFEFFDNFLKIV